MSMFRSDFSVPPGLIAPIVIVPLLIVMMVVWAIARRARSQAQFARAKSAPTQRNARFAVDAPSAGIEGDPQLSSTPYYPQGRPAVAAVSMGMGRPAYYPPITVPDTNPPPVTPWTPPTSSSPPFIVHPAPSVAPSVARSYTPQMYTSPVAPMPVPGRDASRAPTLAQGRALSLAPSVVPSGAMSPAETVMSQHTANTAPPPYYEFRT